MLVTTQEQLDVTRDYGFSIQGIDTKNRRKAVRMGPEDRILYYVSDKKGFAATATITSEAFEDHEPIWKHFREQETFPHRVEIEPNVVLRQEQYVDGYQIGPTLEYVKKWAPDRWPLAFYGMLHIIPQRDFNLIENELKRVDNSSTDLDSAGVAVGVGTNMNGPDALSSSVKKSKSPGIAGRRVGKISRRRARAVTKKNKNSRRRRAQKRSK